MENLDQKGFLTFSATLFSRKKKMSSQNHTTVTEFTLLGLTDDPVLKKILFGVFLVIYLVTLAGNLCLIVLIRTNSHLQTPMYFFLSHLSFLDPCFSSVTMPKLLENLLSKRKIISIERCLTQDFFVLDIGGTEIFLLSAMAYDCYAAICHPLFYGEKPAVCEAYMGFMEPGFPGCSYQHLPGYELELL